MKTNNTMNRAFVLICMGASALLNTGCGKSIVTGVGVTSSVENGDQYAEVYADFNTSGMVVPTVTLPISNPLQPGSAVYGQVELSAPSASTAQVNIDLDLSVLAKMPAGSATLPNGGTVPVYGTEATKVLSIPVPNTLFVIYAAININALNVGDSPIAMVGIAMPFTQFDSLGQSLGTEELFIPANIENVEVTAGVFTGKASGTSGVGIFIDASSIIATVAPAPTPLPLFESFLAVRSRASAPSKVQLEYLSVSPGTSKEEKIGNTLSEMGSRHTHLTIAN